MSNRFSCISRLALACTLAGLAPSIAYADEASDPANTADSILVVGQRATDLNVKQSTGSRLGLSLLETPASIAIVDGETLRARGDLSIQDAVTRAPGITSVANPGNGGTALAARGFDGQGSVMQLVDGIRLFPVAGTITFPTDPWMPERVEVLSGPASVLYGQGALGGAINVVMRQPNRERFEAQGEIGYGSQNTFHAAAGVGGPIVDMLSFRIDGSYRRSDGYVDRGKSESYAVSGALRFQPSDTFSLTLRDDYGNQRPQEYFGTPLIDGRLDTSIRERNFNVADANLHYRDNRTTLTAEWSPSDAITLTNTAYRLTSWRIFKDLESYCAIGSSGLCPNGYNEGSDIDPGTPGLIFRTDNLGIVHDQTQWGDQGSVKLATPLGEGISNTLIAGFDVNLIKLTYSNDFGSDTQADQVNPRNFDPGLFLDTQGIAPRFRTRTNEYAFFAEDRLKFGEHFSIVGGLRYEHDQVRRWTFAYSSAGVRSEALAFDKKLSNTTWRVGAVYQPTSDISLYAQYSTGVDPLGTLTTFSGSQVTLSNATGNQIEFGVKASFLNGHGSATLAAYKIVKHNLFTQLTPKAEIEQVGQRSAKGIEASVSIDLPAGFGIDANGTVLDANFDDFTGFTGNTPPGIAETAANLWLRWDPIKQVQARAGLRYVGKRYSDNANTFKVPAYAVVDASLSYALTDKVAVNVGVYNLFDKDYAITTYNDEQWILGRPRSFDVALRARF